MHPPRGSLEARKQEDSVGLLSALSSHQNLGLSCFNFPRVNRRGFLVLLSFTEYQPGHLFRQQSELSGGGKAGETDTSYLTPYWWLDEQIKKVLPGCYLYDVVQ